jgi:hypothetical protein
VADGTIFENRGIPAASIVTDSFFASANAMARSRGFPGYRYAAIPHPLARLTPDEVKERAREVLPCILEILGVEEGTRP